jgi:hypothetical protein
VRTQKEGERARGTHFLENADRWISEDTEGRRAMGTHLLERVERRISEDTERKGASEGHSRPGERRASGK